jgi:cysteine desulfurase/selenocysteine lyase
MVMSGINLKAARSNITLREGLIYFDHAAQGPLPLSARRAYDSFLDKWQRMDALNKGELFETIENVRAKAGRIIKCDADRIGISATTSFGLNVVSAGYPWTQGDNVVVSSGDFPANIYPWKRLEAFGVETRLAESRDGFIDEDSLIAACDGRTRVLSLSWVQFNNGYRVDLVKLGDFCRRNGILFCVDGIQGTGVVPIDVSSLNIDLFSCGCQKWLFGPCGSAFFYLSERAERMIKPSLMGWMSVDWGDDFSDLLRYDLPPRNGPARYEIGTYPFQDLCALDASLDFVLSFDAEAVWEHIKSLTGRVAEFVTASPFYTLLSSMEDSRRSGIVAVRTAETRKLFAFLRENNIAVSFRENSIRIAPHFYNSTEEVDRLLELLERFQREESGQTAS